MKKSIKIGNAQAFWGDTPTAPATMVQQQPDLDYLTLDYLSEMSMSILAIQKQKDPTVGYAKDFIDVVRSLTPFWQQGSPLKIITNGGGLNPVGCAHACRKILAEHQCSHIKIGVVDGDDVLPYIQQNHSAPLFNNLETGAPISSIAPQLVAANAYVGALPIVSALQSGADIVITGRIADPSMTVGAAAFHYGWSFEQYDLIAQATVAGHLIECGTQVSGGLSTDWLSVPNPASMGFPFVEMAADGVFILTKPLLSGGRVDIHSVKEQLLYEIGDPKAYLSPDGTVSFLTLKLESVGENRVRISGATGFPPPTTYKVSACYAFGYKAEAMLTIFGPHAAEKARRCGEIVRERVLMAGYPLERYLVEVLGCGDSVGQVAKCDLETLECVVRFAAADSKKAAVEAFTKEIAPLITSGPQGILGYTSGRAKVRPLFGFWPCLIERGHVDPHIQMHDNSFLQQAQ